MRKIFIILFFLIYNSCFSQWIEQHVPVTTSFTSINFANRFTGWACGYSGVILKTTNGGNNWISQQSNVANKDLKCIFPVNDTIVYAVGYSQTILKTTNGGSIWQVIEDDFLSPDYYSCYFINEKTGWIGSSGYGTGENTYKTTNGGITFSMQNTHYVTGLDIFFKDSLNGIQCGYRGYICVTSDGGNIWKKDSVSHVQFQSHDLKNISYINDSVVYITAYGGNIYKTTNFGISWDSVSSTHHYMISCKFVNVNVGYAGDYTYSEPPNYIYKTTNGGHNWIRQLLDTLASNMYVNSIYCYDENTIWAACSYGNLFFTSNGGSTDVNVISNIIPDKFKLDQNFPNPFNPQTTIKFSISNKDIYKLEIFNSLGQTTKTLFSKDIAPGEYEVKLNGSNLSSGVYFYKLSSSKYSVTKKMFLLK